MKRLHFGRRDCGLHEKKGGKDAQDIVMVIAVLTASLSASKATISVPMMHRAMSKSYSSDLRER
jgi:hypothetical protein